MTTLHTVSASYVTPEGDPLPDGQSVVFVPVARGTTPTAVVLPQAVTVPIVSGGFSVQLVGSGGEPWWWTVVEPGQPMRWFELEQDFDLAHLTTARPPAVQITGPTGSTGPQGLTGAVGPEGPPGPIGPQGSAVLPDTGWVDARSMIMGHFISDPDPTKPMSQIRRIGHQVSIRLSAQYNGDGTHPFRTPLPIVAVPEGFREVGWHGGVGFGHVDNRMVSVDMAAGDVLTVADYSSSGTNWSRSRHLTLQASWTTDDPLPPGTGATGELPWATAAPSAVGATGSAGTSKLIPHADHTHAGLTVTRTPATGRWLLTAPDGGTLEAGDTGWRNITADVTPKAWMTGVAIYLRRVGGLVHARLVWNTAADVSAGNFTMTVPAGFRPNLNTINSVALMADYISSPTQPGVSFGWTLTTDGLLTAYPVASRAARAWLTWHADPLTWPTTLPGTQQTAPRSGAPTDLHGLPEESEPHPTPIERVVEP